MGRRYTAAIEAELMDLGCPACTPPGLPEVCGNRFEQTRHRRSDVMGLLQRVRQARAIGGGRGGQIGPGLLALVCSEQGDGEAKADRLLAKTAQAAHLCRRRRQDESGARRTWLACSSSTSSPGRRYPPAATARASPGRHPGRGRAPDYFVAQARAVHPQVATGRFGADMQVHLVNDGPVT